MKYAKEIGLVLFGGAITGGYRVDSGFLTGARDKKEAAIHKRTDRYYQYKVSGI